MNYSEIKAHAKSLSDNNVTITECPEDAKVTMFCQSCLTGQDYYATCSYDVYRENYEELFYEPITTFCHEHRHEPIPVSSYTYSDPIRQETIYRLCTLVPDVATQYYNENVNNNRLSQFCYKEGTEYWVRLYKEAGILAQYFGHFDLSQKYFQKASDFVITLPDPQGMPAYNSYSTQESVSLQKVTQESIYLKKVQESYNAKQEQLLVNKYNHQLGQDLQKFGKQGEMVPVKKSLVVDPPSGRKFKFDEY